MDLSLRVISAKFAHMFFGNVKALGFLYQFLLIYFLFDLIILAWFVSAPVLIGSGNQLAYGLSYLAYDYGYLVSNCHQMPQRTLFLGSYPMPFCARDVGIYIGCFSAASLALFRVRTWNILRSWWFNLALLTPLALDGVSQTILALRESSNLLRLLTGFLFGFGLVYYLASKIVSHASGKIDSRRETIWAVSLSLLVVSTLLICGFFYGQEKISRSEAVGLSGLDPDFVTYVSARSTQTLRFDPFLGSYDDKVLEKLLEYGYRGHGVWVIYAGETVGDGKHVYFSQGSGVFELVADVSGSV